MSVLDFIAFVFERIRMGFGMVLPIFSDAADLKNWPRRLRWGLHLLLLGLVLLGLHYLQSRWSSLNTYLQRKTTPGILPYCLDLVFLVLYALSWAGYGFYSLFADDEESPEFPD